MIASRAASGSIPPSSKHYERVVCQPRFVKRLQDSPDAIVEVLNKSYIFFSQLRHF